MEELELLKRKTELINKKIITYLPEEHPAYPVITKAMNYSILAGGKRLRPLFLIEIFKLFSLADCEDAIISAYCFATALEMIHTYSLVHDDLPAMDNDELRRGKPTTHAKFGEAVGILAGDALLNEAFILTSSELERLSMLNTPNGNILVKNAIRAQRFLAECAGHNGMIAGQIIDLDSEGKNLSKELQLEMYELKTSRLLEAAFCIGVILGGGNETQEKDAFMAASRFGKAFQLQDDILDLCGTAEKMGKPIKSDIKNEKSTLISIEGLEETKKEAKEFTIEALNSLCNLPGDLNFLRWLMTWLLERDN